MRCPPKKMWSRDRFSRLRSRMVPNLNMSKFGSEQRADSISANKLRASRADAAWMPQAIRYHERGLLIHFARTVAPSNDVIHPWHARRCHSASMHSGGGLCGLCSICAYDVTLLVDYIMLPGIGWLDATYRPHTTVFGCKFRESGWHADFSQSFRGLRG